MVGLCGAVGDIQGFSALVDDLHWTRNEHAFTGADDEVAVASVVHPFEAEFGYAETESGDRIWLWGSVWGFDGPNGYESFPEGGASQCAARYERHGIAFVEGLNGKFVGVVHDRNSGRVSLFTDRLGTRPLHYYVTDDGIVFSTHIQSLPLHPGVDTGFDTAYLGEYFALKRPFGIRTPLSGVEKTQPGSVTTIRPGGDVSVDRYWRPVYTPLDRSRDYFADRLARTFREVVADRTNRTVDRGLLLSGGSDSRLVLAAFNSLDESVQTFHLTEWRNRETRIAERIAESADVPFTQLFRDRDYQMRALKTHPRFSNFVGYFNQIHAGGFVDVISSNVDVLLTGHYGDMLFKGDHLPTPTVDLGPLGTFDLPYERQVTDVESFVDYRVDESAPSYLRIPRSIREIYRREVETNGSEVIDHGVSYPSYREATLATGCPLTNATSQFFFYGTDQMMPAGTPFLDNRLLDLALSIPVRHLLRGDLINEATRRLAPALADLPHGSGVVPIKYPFELHWAGELATEFVQRHLPNEDMEPHWTHGPWTDHHELIRTHGFVRDTLDEYEAVIRELPFLSWEGVNETYEAHLAGEERMGALYTLVTFLEMPIVERVRDSDSS